MMGYQWNDWVGVDNIMRRGFCCH